MARGLARRRRSLPAAVDPADDAPLPRWVESRIARGKETAAEYRQRVRERRQERIADLIERVPPAVEQEGPDAVRAWAEDWDALDPRVSGARIDAGNDPRAPLTARP